MAWLKKLLPDKTPENDDLMLDVRNKFEHSERTFVYNLFRFRTDCLYCHASPGTLETIIQILDKSRGQKILNLGGGTGQMADIFRYLGHEVCNVDIGIAKEKETETNINFDLNSPASLPVPPQAFDVVLCQEVIEHIENPWKLFRDAKKSLRSGGLFIVSTPNITSRLSRIRFWLTGYFQWFTPKCLNYHINPLPYWEIELIANKTGFELTRLEGSGNYFFKHNTLNQKGTIKSNEGLIFIFRKI